MMRFYITDGDLEGHFEMVWGESIGMSNTAFAGLKVSFVKIIFVIKQSLMIIA